ncbi:MAG TPA: metallophosphoesterase [Verrucomicrobia bacterium]|nr:metallophosphoesterase [Verrucomicrobiota bacterium]
MSKKYAILGDIHANWEALSAVLEDAKANDVDTYVCVGDIVGYNASPSECLEKIREICVAVVRGNHDHYVANDECLEDFHPLAANVIDWTRRQLSKDQLQYLKNLRLSRMVDGFTIVHSTLDMPEKWGYVIDTLDADSNFNYQTSSVCFHGHTHVPVVFERQGRVVRTSFTIFNTTLGRKCFVNTGSVGQPRDGDPRASYVIYDPTARRIELRRVEYDIATTQRKILEAGLPERLARRLEHGK